MNHAGTGSDTGADAQRPWIGLASFTEESRGYFHGRDEEIAELARRVQRKLLTVLFGQSGLGKTSILRAGLVPRLREQGYCPVYVRVDYSADAPEPAEQIKRAIARDTSAAGKWTRSGVAEAGETLWEYLHHRDDLLKDESGRTLTPLLIFDQFEEVFTLAQSDETGRARAARFLAELADLVENRPPASFEARLESDDTLAERFDFARGDYRVLIALREDYLAQLESLKGVMPSITQNRLRLAPMNGAQALEAVLRPGGVLVTQEVAQAIVRFVAGGAEIGNAEVEPSLLSLICRELNDARLARGDAEISLGLLAGSHEEILSNFYERALADQPPQVRRVVEDDLLTDSGFRENIAEERLRKSLEHAGAAPDALSKLVDRRLLRIEERLDVRRVELTHDVLCGVVKRSRDLRQEREAREAAERQLAAQHEREQASRQALRRAVRFAAICGVLALLAVAAAIYGWLSAQRAQRAEQMAQDSRTQAESLLAFLTNDFAEEMSRSGRLDVITALAGRGVDYFHGLPDEIKGPESRRLGALSLAQMGRALRGQGQLDAADAATDEAIGLLEELRRQGDDSADTAVALSRALGVKARILNSRQDPGSIAIAERAVEVVAALAAQPDAPEAVRKIHVEQLVALGFGYQNADVSNEKAIEALEKAMSLAEQEGGKDPQKNLYMAERYAEAGGWLTSTLNTVGRGGDAVAVGRDAGAVAEAILATRPGNFPALFSLGLIEGYLGQAAWNEQDPARALPHYQRATEVYTTITQLDPNNRVYANNRASQYWDLSGVLWSMGRTTESIAALETGAKAQRHAASGGPTFTLNSLRMTSNLISFYAQRGDFAKADDLMRQLEIAATAARAEMGSDKYTAAFAATMPRLATATVESFRRNWRGALNEATAAAQLVRDLEAAAGMQLAWKSGQLSAAAQLAALANLELGDAKAAERWAREALAAHEHSVLGPIERGYQMAQDNEFLAMALVAQGRTAEARTVLAPSVAFLQGLQKKNKGEHVISVEFAKARYVESLTDPARRGALLREAAAVIDATPATVRSLREVEYWRERIRNAGG